MTEKTFDKSKYHRIPCAIHDDYAPIIGAHGIAIYGTIARRCGWDNLPASISYKEIARTTGTGMTTAKKVVKQLEELKLISKTGSIGDDGATLDNVYQLLKPPVLA